ncbi:amidase [Opitutaceae bacterium EW11]|nr:amidase [Opitutaceae bacterium EW11]
MQRSTLSLAASGRRDFLRNAGWLATAFAASSLAATRSQAAPYVSSGDKTDDVLFMSATRLAQLIREKKISSTEAVQAFIARQDAINDRLNAVVMNCHERALAEAKAADEALARGDIKGALHGVPMTIKDSLDTEGVISTGATYGRQQYIPKKDATVVARVRKAGAILLGKTNTPEFTLGGLAGLNAASNLLYGSSHNPYDLTRTTSGSSGGAGASVAAGMSAFDIGSDWGGSIRGPAHINGIVGIKPTSVRVPRTGHIVDFGGVFDLWQQLGPMARRVEDIALITPLIAGPDFHDAACAPVPWSDPAAVDLKKLRAVFFPTNGMTETDDDTQNAVRQAASWLGEAVASVNEDLPKDIFVDLFEARRKLTNGDGWAFYKRMAAKWGTQNYSPAVAERMKTMTPISSAEYIEAWEMADLSKSRMLEWFKSYDVLLCPVAGKPAEVIDRPPGTAPNPMAWSYTGAFNSTGWPVTVVRCGTSADGKLPIGVQVAAAPWREDITIAVAAYLESRSGGWRKPPL